MPETIRSAALANYADVARHVGIDPLMMMRRFRIDARALKDSEMRLPVRRVAGLLEASADKSGCSDFGLRMADRRRVSDLGIVGLLVLHQSTLSDVLDTMVRYRNLLNAALVLHVEEARDVAVVREELVVDFDAPKIIVRACRRNLVTPLSFCAWSPVATGQRTFYPCAPTARGASSEAFWRSHRV